MKKKIGEYFFKTCISNGEEYLQVWKRDKVKDYYVGSVGNATKAYKILVKLRDLKEQTKKNFSNQTKNV